MDFRLCNRIREEVAGFKSIYSSIHQRKFIGEFVCLYLPLSPDLYYIALCMFKWYSILLCLNCLW